MQFLCIKITGLWAFTTLQTFWDSYVQTYQCFLSFWPVCFWGLKQYYSFVFRPEPVLWTKDGGELPDVERMIVEGRDLIITTLNKTDNGTYRCEASNQLGTNRDEFTLYVYGKYFWVFITSGGQ